MDTFSQTIIAPVRSQKSSTWIWTTLWITTTIDAFLITIATVLILSVSGILKAFPSSTASFIQIAIGLIAVGIGSYLASHHVLKKSIVLRAQATRFAFLTVLIPFIGTILIPFLLAISQARTFSPSAALLLAFTMIVSDLLIFGIIRYQLSSKGD